MKRPTAAQATCDVGDEPDQIAASYYRPEIVGRMLVIRRRDNGHYQAPGGILEHAERIEDGLVCEVREETGLLVEPDRLTGIYKHMGLGVIALVFRCPLLGGALTVNDEAVEVTWLDHKEVSATMTEAFAIRITDALEEPWPHIRHHHGTHLVPELVSPAPRIGTRGGLGDGLGDGA